jgi:hypothetical protein
MSGSDRDNRTRLIEWVFPVIGIVVSIALALGVGFLLASSPSDPPAKEQQVTSAARARYAQSVAVRRVDAAPNYAAYPDRNASECYNAEDHDSADLCAQWRAAIAAESSARWSFWAFCLGGVGAFLSAIGLGALWVSLRQTERSLGEARESNRIAAAADRPWLNITAELTPDQPVNWFSSDDQETCIISISFSVQHFGNAPAVNVETIGAIVDGADDIEDAIEHQKRRANNPGRRFLPISVFPGEEPDSLAVGMNFLPKSDGSGKSIILPYLIACASYTNPSTGERHMSIRVYRFSKFMTRISKANCPFPASHLGMVISRRHPPYYT